MAGSDGMVYGGGISRVIGTTSENGNFVLGWSNIYIIVAMKGVPARMTTARSSTTRASRVRLLPLTDKDRRVSPIMERG